jgi:hypothetical protein
MAMTQMQLIQSLGEALAWLEREINWGVPATELRHLCGRIGELYIAMLTNGQMATEVNQRGYDVVSGTGERISVKTTAQTGYEGHASFNPNSLGEVDRIAVLRINTEEMQVEVLIHDTVDEVRKLMVGGEESKLVLPFRRFIQKPKPGSSIEIVKEVMINGYVVRELESGTMEVSREGIPQIPAKPVLREIASSLNIGLLNGSGNPHNTRQLGSLIIKSVQASIGGEPKPIVMPVE